MSNASTYLSSAAIKSVQRGSITSTGATTTTTITAVDTSKSLLRAISVDRSVGGSSHWFGGYVALTNSTTITLNVPSGTTGVVVYWELVEFAAPVKSVQNVSAAHSNKLNGTTVNVAITAVVPSKTILGSRGFSGPGSSMDSGKADHVDGYLSSSTNVLTKMRASTSSSITAHFTVLEFL
jgi:hypothetical protein